MNLYQQDTNYVHNGSLQYCKNTKNYIVFIIENACKQKPNIDCKLWMLMYLGQDCFDKEIIKKIILR